ncbi:hypothetical protein [Caulobacter hibisci]|uniref:Uncharacterized protein n=1 Tax=Caulobacter hibisci TaxID=2035993 RepID=A0ABS0SSV8_9CAUL|nr:hypothetical protein [Caulobacter hibisci]MBI1682668.1 hypothetical protein [Caulobacter hibisci]
MPTVNILIVTDASSGGYNRTVPPTIGEQFHLGEFVHVLRNTDWDGFDIQITKAHRDNPAGAGTDVVNFDFSTHDLNQYDEIFLFPIVRDGGANNASPAEVAAIARFMDRGGGVFATGDHENLGASLCRGIPRVRSMAGTGPTQDRWASSRPRSAPSARTISNCVTIPCARAPTIRTPTTSSTISRTTAARRSIRAGSAPRPQIKERAEVLDQRLEVDAKIFADVIVGAAVLAAAAQEGKDDLKTWLADLETLSIQGPRSAPRPGREPEARRVDGLAAR